MIRIFLALCLLTLSAGPGVAASFDCAKATHKIEKLICSDSVFSTQDEALAGIYAKALDRVFDQNGLREAQRNWQKWLRRECERTECDIQDMMKAYDDRIFYLQDVNAETFEASYKSGDVASLGLYHIDGQTLDFSIIRQHVDAKEGDRPLCRLPASDDDQSALAKMDGPEAHKAHWSNGDGCMIDFTFTRDRRGSVVAIDLVASDACKYYCSAKAADEPVYNLGDRYIPMGDWVPYEMLD